MMTFHSPTPLMFAWISDLLIITTTHVQESLQCLLGVSSAWSMTIVYFLQMGLDALTQEFHISADFLGGSSGALLLVDKVSFGWRVLIWHLQAEIASCPCYSFQDSRPLSCNGVLSSGICATLLGS